MKFIQKNKEIIFGTLLGDSSLQTYTGGKTWRARFIQSDSHKDYLFHLYYLFEEYVSTPPKSITDKNGYTRWYFNTTVIKDLNEFSHYFYHKNTKIIPKNEILFKYLSPVAISYWFMDDGSLKSNTLGYYLCTDSFKLEDLKRLAIVFKEKYNIIVRFHKKGKSYRIYIPRSEYNKFRKIIEEYIHPSMNYKLPII